jgi:hypothetical protein
LRRLSNHPQRAPGRDQPEAAVKVFIAYHPSS